MRAAAIPRPVERWASYRLISANGIPPQGCRDGLHLLSGCHSLAGNEVYLLACPAQLRPGSGVAGQPELTPLHR